MTSQSVREDLGAQSPSIAKGGERDRDRSIVQFFTRKFTGMLDARVQISRTIFRTVHREETAKMTTSNSQPLDRMAVNLDQQYSIYPTRYRTHAVTVRRSRSKA